MKDSKRALYLFILLCCLSVAVASTVMTYWYVQTRTLYLDRMEEVVQIRKSFFESIYNAHKESGDPNPLEHTIKVIENSFHFITDGEYSCDFIVRSSNNKFKLLSRKDCEHLSENIIDMAKLNKATPLSLALSGKSGKTVTKDHYGSKIIAAYDYIDIEGIRFAIVAKKSYSSMMMPKIEAALSAALITVVIIGGGGIGFYRFSGKNISNLKNANEELTIMADIYDSVNDYTAYISNDMRYKSANRAFLNFFRSNPEDIKNRYLGDFVGKTLKENLLIPTAIKCLNGENIVLKQWLTANDERFFAEIKFVPHIVDGSTAGIVLSITDRTNEERARLETLETTEKLRKLTEELEERVKTETDKRIANERLFIEQKKFADMGQMINAIAHQWRQPINSLGLYIQLMYESAKDNTLSDEFLEDFRSDTIKIVQHMSKTIDDFRTFFDPRTTETNFEVIKAVVDTISIVEAQLKNHDIEFTVSCQCASRAFESCNSLERPPCEHPETLVKGFSSEFRQVLTNLVQNAKDVLSEQNARRSIQLAVKALEDRVEITISDNGGGISESILNKIFDPYFTTKPEGKGTGIGLYMSKLIIEEHMKGKLTASNSEKGAVFTISLPKVKD